MGMKLGGTAEVYIAPVLSYGRIGVFFIISCQIIVAKQTNNSQKERKELCKKKSLTKFT